jgi:two-component system LytT family response regulator
MINAIIVDDELVNISNLQSLLRAYCTQLNVIATASTVNDAITLIRELDCDVVFLDIEMPGENGFDLLKSLPTSTRNFEVIFVTAHDNYGISAIKFSALDYLLKPINIAELQNAVQRAHETIKSKKRNARIDYLLERLDNQMPPANQKIALPSQKEIYLVDVKDIVRCESSNNYTTFFLINGVSHLISRPLYEYEELLTPFGFIRCHQSHLVNKTHIMRILNQDSGYLIMQNTAIKIPVSKQRKNLVKSLLSN